METPKIKSVENVIPNSQNSNEWSGRDVRDVLIQDRASIHTSLVAAVEGKKRPISVDDLAINDIHEVYKDGYNAALDDTLTIINSIFKE